MSTEKLSELSKPVAWPNGCNETSVKALRYLAEHKRPIGGSDMYNTEHLYIIARELEIMSSQHLYSQEYVWDLLERIAELEQKERHSERQNVIDGLARSGEAWSDIEEYMVKWDEEHRKAMEAQPVRYQCREIGEGGWTDCDKARYDSCQRRPEMDTRIVTSPLEELEAKDKRIAELEAKTAMTMGVGSGNGNLFVHGDYDSIKAAQAIVLENESLRAKLATPVRLPRPACTYADHSYPAYSRKQVEEIITSAGMCFTVEGDE